MSDVNRPVETVAVLPVLNFGALPNFGELPANGVVVPFNSRWQHLETEILAGIFCTNAVRKGRWVPMSAPDFGLSLSRGFFRFFAQDVVNQAWEHRRRGDGVDFIEYQGIQYIVLTKEFVQKALSNPAGWKLV